MKVSQLAQLVLDASESNIKLYPWQRKWLDDLSRFRIMLKSRAVGGSFLIALEAFIWSLLKPDSTILLVSYSMRQSMELFRKVKEWINRWRGIRLAYEGEIYTFSATLSETKTQVEFQNRSRIISLPNNPDAIRGYRADMVYVDEAAMFKNDFEIKSAVIPTLTGKRGRLSLISTPKGKRGWFYEAWTSETYSKHKVHYSMAPHITKEDLEGMRASLGPLEWEQEMEMKFLDELNALFPYDLILSCTEDYEVKLEPKPNPVYVGIDFGRYRDSTVITALERLEDGSMKVFFIHEFQKTDFNKQVEFIEKLVNVLGPTAVAIDKTGMGIPLYDFLSKRLPQVEGVTITANVKEAMIQALHNAMQNKKLIIPADATELINQLRIFQRIQTKTGHIKYEAPEGEHDDYVLSLALAVYSTLKKPPPKVKIISGFWR